MAFTDLGSIAAGGNTTANVNSLTVATTANVAAGELVVVVVAVDNRITGGGDDLSVSGVTFGGISLTKGRQNATNLAAQAGSSVSLWYGVVPTTVASGQNIVASFTTNSTSDAQCLTARHFSFAGLYATVDVEATNATTATTTNPGSLDAATANIACLRIRAIGCEYDSTQTITGTGSWVVWAEAASAASGTIAEQVTEVVHIISTGTGNASAPTLGSACDSASVYVAFKEVANPFRLPILDVPRGPRRGRDFWIDAVGFVEAAALPEILDADAGTYALTGSAAELTVLDVGNLPAGAVNWFNPWGRKRPVQDWLRGPIPAVPVIFTAASGSYTLTGTAATWALGHAAGSGSYSITGSAAALALGQVAGAGSYTLTGSSAGVAITIVAAAGSYTSTGSVVTFAFGQGAAAGSYTLTGADAAFVIPGVVTYLPAGMSGGYVPWGRRFPINLRTSTGRVLAQAPITLTAAGGSYVITGAAVSFVVATPPDTTNLPAGATVWFNPWRRAYPVSLRTSTGRVFAQAPTTLTAAAGSYTITGSSAVLALRLTANNGSYTVSGTAAVLAQGFAAGAGAYAILGTDANLVQAGAITLTCEAGSYLLTGSDVSFGGTGITPPPVEAPGGNYTGMVVGAGRGRMIRRRKRGELDIPPDLEPPPLSPPDLPPPAPGPKPPDLLPPQPGLMADMPMPQRKPLPPAPDDEDEDEIALLLEILNRS